MATRDYEWIRARLDLWRSCDAVSPDDAAEAVHSALTMLDTERTAHEATRALARELASSLSTWVRDWYDESGMRDKRTDALLARAREAGVL